MIESASKHRCPNFSICKDTIHVPASDRAVIIPAYSCTLVVREVTPEAGQPDITYGPDGSPVSPQSCTLQRYETECKLCTNETVTALPKGQLVLQEAQQLVQQPARFCSSASSALQRASILSDKKACQAA